MSTLAETQVTLTRVDDGDDGYSPTAIVTKSGNTATIEITDKDGTTTAQVLDGTNGVSISSVKTQYYLSTSSSSATGGSWSDTPQTFVSGKYYWTRDYITYSDGTHGNSTPVYNQGLTLANEYALSASVAANSALVSLSNVEDVAGVLEWITNHGTMISQAQEPYDADNVYFIVDQNGDYEVAGTRYSIVSEPREADKASYYCLSIDKSIQNYVSTHLAVNSEGLWIIPDANGSPTSNGKKILIATGAGSTYTSAGTYIIDRSSGTDHVYAKFLADGATMTSGDGIQIAHLGYGSGNAETGTANAPYYSIGARSSSGDIGNYSMAEGRFTIASGYCSHAEGGPLGSPNNGPVASGEFSHAEGGGTVASNKCAHAEGSASQANGLYSHAQNASTIANGNNQTALGKYNVADTTSAVIIGNGSDSLNRSNALTVDWNGNVNIPSGATYQINGTPIGSSAVSGVKGNAESTYRTGNVNITPANVGAVALSDKYKRSSAGDLAWTGQTDGDAKLIAKSALAFWDGAYSGNASNLSKCSTGNIIGSNGGTMTGQLLTSFKSSVAVGSYGTEQTTLPNFVEEVRFSSGCVGSVNITTAYTKNNVTVSTGWYNFLYSPHRSGGNSGAASGDNCNYGTLIIAGMTTDTCGTFFIRISSGAIQSLRRVAAGSYRTTFTPTSGNNYATYGGCYYEYSGHIVHVHIGVNGLTANTLTTIYTLPADVRPTTMVFGHGTGGTSINIGYAEIATSGVIKVRAQSTACGVDITYMI